MHIALTCAYIFFRVSTVFSRCFTVCSNLEFSSSLVCHETQNAKSMFLPRDALYSAGISSFSVHTFKNISQNFKTKHC